MTPTFVLDRVNRLARFDADLPLCIAQRWLSSQGFSLPLLRPIPGASLHQLCQRAPSLVEALVRDAVLHIHGDSTPLQTLSSPRAAMGPSALAAAFCHPPLARMKMANVRVLPLADVTSDVMDRPRAGAGAWLLEQFHQRHGFVLDVVAVGDRLHGALMRARTATTDLAQPSRLSSLPAARSSTFHTASALLPRAADIQQALDRGERVIAWPQWWRMTKTQPRPVRGAWSPHPTIPLDAACEQLAQAMRRSS
jgi:hypothetical protein